MSFSAPTAALSNFLRRQNNGGAPYNTAARGTSAPTPMLLRAVAVAFPFLFCLCLFPVFSLAEVLLEPRIGYRGTFQLGHPFPLEVTVHNSGPAGDGTVEVRIWKGGAAKGGAPYPVHYRRDIYLAARATKAIQFTVDPDFISRPLNVHFTGTAGSAFREVDLRRHFSPAPVVLLVTEGGTTPPVFLAPWSQSRLIAASLSELPPDARAWLGVSHLILYEQSLRDFSRAQFLALDTWVSAGGRLIVLGSLNYGLYQEPALSGFLPVRVTGARRITWVAPHAGKGTAALRDVWTQVATLKSGKVLAEAEGLPLLVEANRGKGRIIYFALDVGRPPLSNWDGLGSLVRSFLAPAAADMPALQARWDDSVFSQLVLSPSFASAYVPAGSLFAANVIYLAGIGVFAWLWHKQRPSPRIFFASFATFLTGAALAGHLLFTRGGNIPDGVLLAATLIENSVGGYAEAQTNVALFSTQIRPYTLELKRGWIDLVPVSGPARERSEAMLVSQDGNSSRYRFALREWDYRLFRVRSVAPFDVRAEFNVQGDKLLMQVDNQAGKDLIDCWLLLPGQRHAVGAIPRGARWSKTVSIAQGRTAANGTGRSDAMEFRDLSFPDKAGEALFHSSFFSRHNEPARWNDSALFFGWVKDPERMAHVDDPGMRAHHYTLFRASFPLHAAEDE